MGKTTTTINLAAALAASEVKVLVLDCDPQGNTTSGLGVQKSEGMHTLYDVLLDGKEIAPPSAKRKWRVSIPSGG